MAKRDNAPKRKQTNRKLTSNQQEWKHQVSNLKRRIRDLERQGAIVDFKIPEMPKIVRKEAIEKLKNIRRRDLIRGVEYTPPAQKKEIKYKPAQQINEEGKLEKWKAPERGKVKEREAEVRARKIAQDIIDLAREVKAIQPPQEIPAPKVDEPKVEEPKVEEPKETHNESWYNGEDYDEDGEYWDEYDPEWDMEYRARREQEEEDLRIADAQIENLRGYINDLGDDSVVERLNNILNNMIAINGKEAVANNVEANLGTIAQYGQLAVKYKDTTKGNGFVNQIAQLLQGDRILTFGELAVLEKANDYNDDFSQPV